MISTSFDCFGVRIDGLGPADVLRAADLAARPFWIVTANPEILLEARRNSAYRDTLNRAGVRVVDGAGLQFAGLLCGKMLKRTTGVDLAQAILDRAVSRGETVTFVGGGPDVAQRALERQTAAHPELRGYAFDGGLVNETGEGDGQNEEARHQIALLGPQVMFVAFGHPKQEMWIARHLRDFPSVRTIIGVGGTFDYWAGTVKRAPAWMRSLGLEWLHRLIREPRRIKRIWNAVIIFPILFVLDLLFDRHTRQTD